MRRKWTKEEDAILERDFATSTEENLRTILSRTWSSIEHRAHRLGLSKDNIWAETELTRLIEIYGNETKENLLNAFPNRTWSAITNKGKSLNISSRRYRRKSDISKLLNDSHISLYWIGFLFADGHFNTHIGKHAIEVCLAKKDESHVHSFASYIECANVTVTKDGKPRVRACDSQNVRAIAKKYDVKSRKTYDPPNVSVFKNLTNELCLSLIIGFFDGDGHVTKKSTGRIQVHRNWLNIMEYFSRVVGTSAPSINKQGYTDWYIPRPIMVNLVYHAMDYDLPIMERKWKFISTGDVNQIPVIAKSQSLFQA